MSFQMALEDAQTELALDETFAFLDGFDLSAYDNNGDNDAFCGTHTASISSFTSNVNSSSFSVDNLTELTSGDDFSADSDDSLSSLLSQFGDGSGPLFEFSDEKLEFEASSCSPQSAEKVQPQQQQQMNKTQQQAQPSRMKKVARTSKTTATANAAASSTSPAPAAINTAGPATKRPRKHNRIEILKLREQIEELQARHAQLQNFGSNRQQLMQTSTVAAGAISVSVSVAVAEQHAMWKKTKQRKTSSSSATAPSTATTLATTTAGGAPRSVWLELAVEQYKQLQQSEELNRKLRDAVAKQLKVTNSFQSLLTKKVSFQDLDLLLDSSSPSAAAACMQSELVNLQDQKVTEQCRRMESQFHETGLICHTISAGNDVTSVFTTSQTKQDPVRGPLFELTTNTPVPSDFLQLGRLMWNRIIEKKDIPVVDSHMMPQLTQSKPFLLAFHDKHVQMKLTSKFGELVVDGSVALSKFEEANRVIITVASTHSVANSDFVFRESAWIVVSENASAAKIPGSDELRPFSWGQLSSSKALFQTYYRLHSEKHDPRSATGTSPFAADEVLDEKTAYLREFVMKSLSDNMRQHMAQLQNSLLSEVGSLASNIMDVRCPMIECPC